MLANPFRSVCVILFLAAICVLFASTSNANGVNPPRPAGGTIVQATCALRATGVKLVLHRAMFAVQGSQKKLFLTATGIGEVALDLYNIKSLQIPSAKPGNGGLLNVEATLRAPEFTGNASIRLQQGSGFLEIVGFDDSKTRRKIRLTECSALTVSLPGVSVDELPKRGQVGN